MGRGYHARLILCVATTMLVAPDASLQATTHTVHMRPSTVAFTALGGVEINMWQVDPLRRRLVFNVQGREATSVTATMPLRFAFDVRIVRVALLEAPRTMRIDSLILERTATFTFGRDPFMPPQAWQCTVMIEFEMLPTTGHMRIGAGDVQLVTYTPTPAIPPLEPSARRPDSN